jgi:hypothetical protein
MPVADEWDCEAYGPEAAAHGARCFFAELGERVCTSLAGCREAMAAERRRVWSRIQEMAAQGDPAGEFLAEAFSGPEQLLGGGTGTAEDRGEEGDEDG